MARGIGRSAIDAYEASIIARADHFTACRFLGQGKYDRLKAPTQEAVVAEAEASGGRWMIYAVTAEGRSVHVRNVGR
jgi:hypothetical protein